jgi:isoleucyl-tRNA synthetase
VDEKGKKMSKSLGNVVDPQTVVKEFGADVLRLWVASTDFRNDMAVSKNILKQINEGFSKIRNTCRFMLSNINGFDPLKDRIEYKDLKEIDKYILMKLEQLTKKARDAYDGFEFHLVYHGIYGFCVNDLSSFYLDVIKDRLYCDATNSRSRKAAQTVCHEILTTIVKLMAPVMSFTAEDLYRHFGKGSVFSQKLPDPNPGYLNENLQKNWEMILEIRGEAYKKIEELRGAKTIGTSSECELVIAAKDEVLSALKAAEDELGSVFMVSSVKTERSDGLSVTARKTETAKCLRCWRYLGSVGKNEKHPGLCDRCGDVVEK